MKHVYSVLILGPDGGHSIQPCASLKQAETVRGLLNQSSLPGWSRYVIVEAVEDSSRPPLVPMPGTDCDFKEKVGKVK